MNEEDDKNMSEKEIKLKAKDGKTIYGVLNSKKESDKLIIFIHGLSGHINEHIFFNAVPYFNKKGFDTLRVSLYTFEKNARTLTDCTLETHGEDIKQVVKYFRKKYKKIYAVGHSYGGPSILFSDPNAFTAITLWDPTYKTSFAEPEDPEEEVTYIKSRDAYALNWGVEILVGSRMVKEANGLVLDDYIRNVHVPLKVIVAGKIEKYSNRKEYMKYGNDPKELVGIKGADHTFNPEGTEKELFDETYKWFKKY